ncbi:hypothetical protein CLOM_g3947 [Closterium sp. NIES-68]|nr:hypothetical protein CLOM_g3947 [Closterium sp. NIES-68]
MAEVAAYIPSLPQVSFRMAPMDVDEDPPFHDANQFFADADEPEEEIKFDTLLETFKFLASCNKGVGLSSNDVWWFFKLIKHAGFNVDELKNWNTKHAIDKYALEQLGIEKRRYKTEEVEVTGWHKRFKVKFLDPVEALIKMWADPNNREGFVHRAKAVLKNGERVYGAAHTADFWLDGQKGLPEDELVCPIIISSDETVLSGNELVKAWPVYLTFTNIPLARRWLDHGRVLVALLPLPDPDMEPWQRVELFQRAIDIVFKSMWEACRSSLPLTDPFGEVFTVWPKLYSYVADYPEGCRVTSTMQHGSSRPCSVCYVTQENLDDMDPNLNHWRTVECQKWLSTLDQKQREAYSTHAVPSFLWNVNREHEIHEDWGNPYKAIMLDGLHVILIGVWQYILEEVVKGEDIAERNRRHGVLVRDERFSAYKLPPEGRYFKPGANYSGAEHAAMIRVILIIMGDGLLKAPVKMTVLRFFVGWYHKYFRVDEYTENLLQQYIMDTKELVRLLDTNLPRAGHKWKIVKIHGLVHFPDFVRRGGAPGEYSTGLFEHAHTTSCKRPFRASNFRNYDDAIMRTSEMRCALRDLPSVFDDLPARETAIIKAEKHQHPVLTATSTAVTLPHVLEGRKGESTWEALSTQHDPGMTEFPAALALHDIEVDTIHVHTAVALPASDMNEGHYARATTTFHGSPWFSYVSLDSMLLGSPMPDTPPVQYGQLLMLFHVQRRTGRDVEKLPFAYVRLLDVRGEDRETSFLKLVNHRRADTYCVVHIDAILRAEHVVPMFQRTTLRLLNKYAW